MSRSTSRHAWLRRVSDYHSGGVSDAERAAVEAHLATCQECQEALAMYRLFYGLLRSPLRLGPPSAHFAEDTGFITETRNPPDDMRYPRHPRPPRRSRALATVAAAVAAILVVTGFLAVYATRNGNPSVTSTPTPQPTVISTIASTVTSGPTTTAQPDAFICANPPGSNLTYAYTRGDHRAYVVTGCATPQLIPLPGWSSPIAWSPTNRYLAVMNCSLNANDSCPFVIYDPSNGQVIETKFVSEYPSEASIGKVIRFFIGWVDDNTFLGALQPVVSNTATNPLGTSTIVKVDVASQAETAVGKVAWFAGTKIVAPNYLFYAGLKSMSEGQAYLHRLDLRTGADTRLVPLGEYGRGGCQVSIFCNWTAPWDVSPDGLRVVYHNPAPTSFPSDINIVQDTPLVYANIDGTNASTPFGPKRSGGLSAAYFSPDGNYLVGPASTTAQTTSNQPRFGLLRIGGAMTDVQGRFDAWRGDGQAMVLEQGDPLEPVLYDLASNTTIALEPNAFLYLWGN